ncbi:MAG: serine hydrolase [Rhizobiales bacterium]|nr:serine hydrolase [Hyphomicrobiales bacterium]
MPLLTAPVPPRPLATPTNGACRRLFLAAAILFAASTPGTAEALKKADGGVPVQIAARPEGGVDEARLSQALDEAAAFPSLRTVIVARDGETVAERRFRGPGLDTPVNVKSVAKTVIAALVGAAIERDVLKGVEQTIAPLLGDSIPTNASPRVRDITVEHLLAMRAGLERTSGANYGRWIQSRNWVAFALSRPFVDEPGGRMLYSTGNSHLLSALLTRSSGRSTLDLARDWLGDPLGIEIPAWERDPQGIFLGGNNMALSPRALLRIGELYRNGGVYDEERVFPESWVRDSWTPQGRSQHSGHDYGYGWFIAEMRGHPVYYAWGYGGQMIYVVPSLGLTAVMTSDPAAPSGRNGYIDQLHSLFADGIMASAEQDADSRSASDGAPG